VSATATPTRQRLLAAAQELMEEGGYGAVSVVAIAERAGVAAGTLYRHFPSKEELFVEVFRAVCAREERAMRRLRSRAQVAVVISVAAHNEAGRHATIRRRLTLIFST
jgi:AcrR family transcriptional regulator